MTDCLQHHGDAAGRCGAVHISVGKRKGAAEAMAEAKNTCEEVAGDDDDHCLQKLEQRPGGDEIA